MLVWLLIVASHKYQLCVMGRCLQGEVKWMRLCLFMNMIQIFSTSYKHRIYFHFFMCFFFISSSFSCFPFLLIKNEFPFWLLSTFFMLCFFSFNLTCAGRVIWMKFFCSFSIKDVLEKNCGEKVWQLWMIKACEVVGLLYGLNFVGKF